MDNQEIEIKRETDKIGLQMFVDHLKDNNFEDSVETEFSKLKNQLDQEIADFKEKNKKGGDLDIYLDTEYFDDRLIAIVEMKIVYLYKNFEINLKKLLAAAYSVDSKVFYRWESVKSFLKQKKIILNTIVNYQEVDQLRKVNNSVKHSSHLISKEIKSINEFGKIKYLRHYELDEFYERVRYTPMKFLQSLSEKIYEDLYIFDESRLESIAKYLSLRMDKANAEKLIEKIKDKY